MNEAKTSKNDRFSGNVSISRSTKALLSKIQTDIWGERFLGIAADTLLIKLSQQSEFSTKIAKFTINGGLSDYQIRRTDAWQNFSRTAEIGGAISGTFGIVSYTRRFFFALDSAAGNDQISDLISARCAKSIAKTSVTATYQLSRSQTETMQKIYTFVGDGEGNYSWNEEIGEFYPDADGDYILEYEPTGEFQPVIRSDGAFALSAPVDFVPYGASISLEASFHSENRNDATSSYYLSPFRMFSDDSLTYGYFLATARAVFLRKLRTNAQLTSSLRKTANHNYSSGAEFFEKVSNTLELNGELPFSITANGIVGLEQTQSLRPTLASWIDASKLSSCLALTGKPISWLRTTLAGEVATISDKGTIPRTEAHQFSMSLDWTIILSKFSFRSHAKYISLLSDAPMLPYELSQGWSIGGNYEWNSTLSYRLGSQTECSFIYRGDKRPSIDAKHTAELRVRLIF